MAQTPTGPIFNTHSGPIANIASKITGSDSQRLRNVPAFDPSIVTAEANAAAIEAAKIISNAKSPLMFGGGCYEITSCTNPATLKAETPKQASGLFAIASDLLFSITNFTAEKPVQVATKADKGIVRS